MGPAQNLAQCDERPQVAECEFARAVIAGLSKTKKELPCRFFYDARGSQLFEEITRLPEYYPTRTETEILRTHVGEMLNGSGRDVVLVEFGSGSSLKTEILLDHLAGGVTYVPIDVSESALAEARTRLQDRYPDFAVRPIIGDFSATVELPKDLEHRRKIGFFPGSTIGNLTPQDAANLLSNFATTLGAEAALIIGVDLKKDVRTLVAAYNDADGVTAEFNLNLLRRINRELGGTFDDRSFRHTAVYNPREGRIEMHLVSTRDQTADVMGRRFHFRANESIHTENSYKYALDEFGDVARRSGWTTTAVWTDAESKFSVHLLTQ